MCRYFNLKVWKSFGLSHFFTQIIWSSLIKCTRKVLCTLKLLNCSYQKCWPWWFRSCPSVSSRPFKYAFNIWNMNLMFNIGTFNPLKIKKKVKGFVWKSIKSYIVGETITTTNSNNKKSTCHIIIRQPDYLLNKLT